MCANKAKTQSNTNAYGRKGDREGKKLYINASNKERKNRPQMPVAKEKKEEQTINAGGKRKMAALTRQANS